MDGLGGELYHIRARLKRDERITMLPVRGVWLNAAWGAHQERIQGEILGESDGNPNQTYFSERKPILQDETVEVRVWAGSGSDLGDGR